MTIAAILVAIAGGITLLLGVAHLSLLYFSDKFTPDGELANLMSTNLDKFTNTVPMSKAWVGFNASHSLGAIYIGIMNLLWGISYFEFFSNSILLILLNGIAFIALLVIALKYWPKPVKVYLTVANLLIIISTILIFIK